MVRCATFILGGFFPVLTVAFFRVSPLATCEQNKKTPFEIAFGEGKDDVLSILMEFSEPTDNMKIMQLSVLMNKDEQMIKKMADFENLINSLPVDLVSRPVGFLHKLPSV